MEAQTGAGKVFVFLRRRSNAGIEHKHVLPLEDMLQRIVKPGAEAVAAFILRNVDGSFRAPLVGLAGMEGGGIGVAEYAAVLFRRKPGVEGKRAAEPSGKFFFRRHVVFKAYGRFAHIGRINAEHGRNVGFAGRAYAYVFHGVFLHDVKGGRTRIPERPGFSPYPAGKKKEFFGENPRPCPAGLP